MDLLLTAAARLAWTLVAALVLFCLYTLFVVAPVSFYAEAECLRNGYPKASVTVGLERYCMTLDGSVTVKVTKP